MSTLEKYSNKKKEMFPMPTTKQPLMRLARLVAMMRENRYPNFPKLLKEMQKLEIGRAHV